MDAQGNSTPLLPSQEEVGEVSALLKYKGQGGVWATTPATMAVAMGGQIQSWMD